ncbi:MAG: hypothetical protein IT372_08265 [Polyangiaceae bacterium]|nr:hypothetical protein [Polyangiaceae bacterium]
MGSLALVMVAGCSKQTPPPAEPQTIESMPPEAQPGEQAPAPEQQPAPPGGEGAQPLGAQPQGAQPQGTQPQGAQPQGAQPQGMYGPGTTQGQPGFGVGAPGQQGDSGEAMICNELEQTANVRVENTATGAVLIMTPKSGKDMAAVRQVAQRIEARMQPSGQGAQAAPQAGGAAQCALFDIGRAGARATIQETPTSIRLLLTAPDRSGIEEVRRRAKDFAGQPSGQQKSPPSR